MRTAVTIGKLANGKWELVHGPDVAITEQQKSLRAFKLGNDHRFVLMQHQESDGQAFNTVVARTAAPAPAPEPEPVKPTIAPAQPHARGRR